ncbi:MAG: hypothetical protein RR902_03390 [Oscillospiraceae bacterium]
MVIVVLVCPNVPKLTKIVVFGANKQLAIPHIGVGVPQENYKCTAF